MYVYVCVHTYMNNISVEIIILKFESLIWKDEWVKVTFKLFTKNWIILLK